MPASRDEAEDLRREMETHLLMLEEDARREGRLGADATADAQRRFGSAVAHFQAAMDTMHAGQRALRHMVVVAVICAATALVGGVILGIVALRSLQTDMSAIRQQIAASQSPLNQPMVTCIILLGRWTDSSGKPCSIRMPVAKDQWDSWAKSTGLQCSDDEIPGFLWSAKGQVAKGLGIPEGVSVWFTAERVQELQSIEAATDAGAFKKVTADTQTVRCVPKPLLERAVSP